MEFGTLVTFVVRVQCVKTQEGPLMVSSLLAAMNRYCVKFKFYYSVKLFLIY